MFMMFTLQFDQPFDGFQSHHGLPLPLDGFQSHDGLPLPVEGFQSHDGLPVNLYYEPLRY